MPGNGNSMVGGQGRQDGGRPGGRFRGGGPGG